MLEREGEIGSTETSTDVQMKMIVTMMMATMIMKMVTMREGGIGSVETSTGGAVENSVCSKKSAYLMLELG